MAPQTEHRCPSCETETSFHRTASTLVHLGEKTKWRCEECDHAIVRIGTDIEVDAPVRS